MSLWRQVHKGRLAIALCLIAVGAAIGLATTRAAQHADAAQAAGEQERSSVSAVLHAADAHSNPYGLPYRNTQADAKGSAAISADAVYFPTEKGRHVVCLVHNLGYQEGVMSCDWAGYHARYGPDDPFDQR